jgi:uncharacterized membrane protein
MATSDQLEQQLQRWTDAGVLDSEAAGRIRDFESVHESPGVRWPVIFAIAFGSIMVAAGVLLFVAAHWDDLSPTQRLLLVLTMIAGFHLAGGVFIPRFRALGLSLHAIGTVALGGGIYLAGQIFNLQEHWPGGILLWAIGAVLSWLVLRDWLQATLSALLVPAWIASEWSVRAGHYRDMERLLFEFVVLLSITYLSARRPGADSYFRRALVWVGGLGVLPICAGLAILREPFFGRTSLPLPFSLDAAGLMMAFALPLLAAYFLRGKSATWNVGYAVWVYVIGRLDDRNLFENLSLHFLCALASVGLVVWGLRENRRERINVGVAGFAFTVMAFYFSDVMGKLDRSAALVGFGVLFLLGGWQLEQLRRKLVAHTRTAPTATGGVA